MMRTMVLILFSWVALYAYSNEDCADISKSVRDVVRKCKKVAKPMATILDGYLNSTIVTNKGVVCVVVSNDVGYCKFQYPLLENRYPK